MKKILILAGGYSKEKEVSIQTAKSVYSELNKDKNFNFKGVIRDGKFVEVTLALVLFLLFLEKLNSLALWYSQYMRELIDISS